MTKFRWILVMMLVLAFTLHASWFTSLKGSGRIVTDERKISPDFSGVAVANHGDLYVKIGDAVSLTLEGDDNILPRIVTRVEGDTLVIRTEKSLRSGWSSRRGIRYHLTVKKGQLNHLSLSSHGDAEVPELTGKNVRVRLSSHGDMDIKMIKTDDLELRLSSHGDIDIGVLTADSIDARMSSHGKIRISEGKVRDQDISLSSHGDYLAAGVRSDHCRVSNSSHGTIKVWVEKSLSARLTSHGRLYLKGDPEIDASKNSREKIRKI